MVKFGGKIGYYLEKQQRGNWFCWVLGVDGLMDMNSNLYDFVV